jgi:hypothetical protein
VGGSGRVVPCAALAPGLPIAGLPLHARAAGARKQQGITPSGLRCVERRTKAEGEVALRPPTTGKSRALARPRRRRAGRGRRQS